MSHALTPSSPILNSQLDSSPLGFFTHTLIPFLLAFLFDFNPASRTIHSLHYIHSHTYHNIPLPIHTFIPPSSCHAKLLQFRWDSVEIKVGTSKVTGDLNSWV